MKIKDYTKLFRIEQWYKNLLVFLGAVFAFKMFEFSLYPILLLTFISACLISSASYIINDILDIERDRKHPEKRLRPIASGKISIKEAIIICIIIFLVSTVIAYKIDLLFTLTILAFFASSQLYSIIFKKIAVVDVLMISINYVLRAIAGCYPIKVKVSPWLIVGVFFVALLLVLGKRRNELSLLGEEAHLHKEVFRVYTEEILDRAVTFTSSIIIITYALYSMHSPIGDFRLLLTLPLITFIVMRYNLLLEHKNPATRNVHDLLKDKPVLLSLALWLLLIVILLYFTPTDLFEY